MSIIDFPTQAQPSTEQRVREAFAALVKPNKESARREREAHQAKLLARALPPLLRSIRALATDENQRELIDVALGELRQTKVRAKAG